ncbi:MAG: helix-turn-helix domain-containing protein [Rhizobiaceae bacterium]|nr:helix-turn-helix domain-containing protein [Rhizobiaceae bacterium]
MELSRLEHTVSSRVRQYNVDEWMAEIHTFSGRWTVGKSTSPHIWGDVCKREMGGLSTVRVATDIDWVKRDFDDIRADFGEDLLLFLQLEGVCGIDQQGRQTLIAPGDCALVDMGIPSKFHFNGQFSNHLCIHLPRQLLTGKIGQKLDMGQRLPAEDPMALMLRALVLKLEQLSADDRRAMDIQLLLFETVRQVFGTEEKMDLSRLADTSAERLEIVQDLIDQHLTHEYLTPRWLAKKMGISLRTLQEDFTQMGITPTLKIRTRRLHLARDLMRVHKHKNGRMNIAEIAFQTGFNDLSYFNRCFRKTFDCAPSDLAHAALKASQ